MKTIQFTNTLLLISNLYLHRKVLLHDSVIETINESVSKILMKTTNNNNFPKETNERILVYQNFQQDPTNKELYNKYTKIEKEEKDFEQDEQHDEKVEEEDESRNDAVEVERSLSDEQNTRNHGERNVATNIESKEKKRNTKFGFFFDGSSADESSSPTSASSDNEYMVTTVPISSLPSQHPVVSIHPSPEYPTQSPEIPTVSLSPSSFPRFEPSSSNVDESSPAENSVTDEAPIESNEEFVTSNPSPSDDNNNNNLILQSLEQIVASIMVSIIGDLPFENPVISVTETLPEDVTETLTETLPESLPETDEINFPNVENNNNPIVQGLEQIITSIMDTLFNNDENESDSSSDNAETGDFIDDFLLDDDSSKDQYLSVTDDSSLPVNINENEIEYLMDQDEKIELQATAFLAQYGTPVDTSLETLSDSGVMRTSLIGETCYCLPESETFDDVREPWQHGKITKIELNYYASVIRYINITYADGTSFSHGKKYSNGNNHIINLDENQYIVKVSGQASSAFIRQITFNTNDGKIHGPFGVSGDTPFSFDFGKDEEVLLYIFGRANSNYSLFALGFASIPLSSTPVQTLSTSLTSIDGVTRTATVGGSGGDSPFDDAHTPWQYGKIVQIELYNISSFVDFIGITYENGQSFEHGNKLGDQHIINLEENQHITKVSGLSGTLIDQITFETNDGITYGPYGGSGGSSFDFDFGGDVLIYIFGRYGDWIDQLGFAHISLSTTPGPTVSFMPTVSDRPSRVPSATPSSTPSVSIQPSNSPSSSYGVIRTARKGGSTYGSPFDDRHPPWTYGRIIQIELYADSYRIRYICITYETGESFAHGGKYGTQHNITLGEDQYITKVSGRTSAYFRQLKLERNDGIIFGPYGNSATYFTAFNFDFGGNGLLYIFGRADSFDLYQLGFAHVLPPTLSPTVSNIPSLSPSSRPTMIPSVQPSKQPSSIPSSSPIPSSQPSMVPSVRPSTQPSSNPSTSPSLMPSELEPDPLIKVDFSQAGSCPSLNCSLHDGAQVLTAPGGRQALRIDSDGPYAKIHGIDIGPSNMPDCTLTIGLYLESIPVNATGWVFGHNQLYWNRTIVLHDPQYSENNTQGVIASGTGQVWKPWDNDTLEIGTAPTKQWFHVAAVFRQGGECAVYLNGVKSDFTTIGNNHEGLPDLYVGRPYALENHWADAWIKEVKVFDEALGDAQIQFESDNFIVVSSMPSLMPSLIPSSQPSVVPSLQPSKQPSSKPSSSPSSMPSLMLSLNPSSQPSLQPSSTPSESPIPSSQPSIIPSVQSSTPPSLIPSPTPSLNPSSQPSSIPSVQPSKQPSSNPSTSPSLMPSLIPSLSPSSQPSSIPSVQPSIQPSSNPSTSPSLMPSLIPSLSPSSQPSSIPSVQPSKQPSSNPSKSPSLMPSLVPSLSPSSRPSVLPSVQPSKLPSIIPSTSPTSMPSLMPSLSPSSQPSMIPSVQPSKQPSLYPTILPSVQASKTPSVYPSLFPSKFPSDQPSKTPSVFPSLFPSKFPSDQPSKTPSVYPSLFPSKFPSDQPSKTPSMYPSLFPSKFPSDQPFTTPTVYPSLFPSKFSSDQPSKTPSVFPSLFPSKFPSKFPSDRPSKTPSVYPSLFPSKFPSDQPSKTPSVYPSVFPPKFPSDQPFTTPTVYPSVFPSKFPSDQPFTTPTVYPSLFPLKFPSDQPSKTPSVNPSLIPSKFPLDQLFTTPTVYPSVFPSKFPSDRPFKTPSVYPSIFPSKFPSVQSSEAASVYPSIYPLAFPSTSVHPSINPLVLSSNQPSRSSSMSHSLFPSDQLTVIPSVYPTTFPSFFPSKTTSVHPSVSPSVMYSNKPPYTPSFQPTIMPTLTQKPSDESQSINNEGDPTYYPVKSIQCKNKRECLCDSKPNLSTNFRKDDVLYDIKAQTLLGISMLSQSDKLQDVESPQYKAACWALFDDPYQYVSKETNTGTQRRMSHQYRMNFKFSIQEGAQKRMMQRYIMAVLYFSTKPNNWQKQYSYLSSRSECEWNEESNYNGVLSIQGSICDKDDNIISLHLANNNLNGTIIEELNELKLLGLIPSVLGQLSKLRNLYLSHNELEGTIHPQIFNAKNLEKLDLSGNKFGRTIPDTIGNLRQLSSLKLNENDLSGSIPDAIYFLKNLQTLNLSSNKLSSSISSLLGNLKKLKLLDLSDNILSGEIPSRVGELSSLEELKLSNNMLSGSIPSTVGELTSLSELSLDNNTLTGKIPESLFNISSLRILKLQNNDVTGSIPDQLCDIDDLNFQADCQNDIFEPQVSCSCCSVCSDKTPKWYGECADATIQIEIDRRPIEHDEYSYSSDGLDWSLMNAATKKRIPFIAQDGIGGGTACVAFSDCISIDMLSPPIFNTYFEIYWNNERVDIREFPGSLELKNTFEYKNDPFQFDEENGDLTSCRELELTCVNGDSKKELKFDPGSAVHISFSKVTSLFGRKNILDTSSDQSKSFCSVLQNKDSSDESDLSDTEITQRFVLTMLHVSNTRHLFGEETYPPSSNECEWNGIQCKLNNGTRVVTGISLSSENNQIINGTLIEELGGLQFLETLELNQTQLHGFIPKSFSNLWSLTKLDLSQNELTGTLPENMFRQLNKLKHIDLSDNKLSGRINEDIGSFSRISSLDLSKNQLTGSFPLHEFNWYDLEYLDVSENVLNSVEFLHLIKHTKLKLLDLSTNFFVGSLHEDTFTSLSKLEYFNISQNDFSGTIPLTFPEVSNITHFDMHANHIKGVIPVGIKDLSSIQYINLQGNELAGGLPSQINQLKNLDTLVLSHNEIKGTIPFDTNTLNKINKLHLHGNYLEGEAPRFENMNSYITDCGFPSASLKPISCPTCNTCCNADGNCQAKSTRKLTQVELTIFFICIIILLLTICYMMKYYITHNKYLETFFCERVGLWNAMKLISEKSVYHFLLTKNRLLWFIAVVCVVFQGATLFLFVQSADIANEASDREYTMTCPANSLECENSKKVSSYGKFVFVLILTIWLMKDIIDSVKLMLVSFQHRNIDFFFASTVVFTITMLSLWSSIVYIIAIAVKNTDLIRDAVILLFVIEIDERIYELVERINPEWVKNIERDMRNSFVYIGNDLVISSVVAGVFTSTKRIRGKIRKNLQKVVRQIPRRKKNIEENIISVSSEPAAAEAAPDLRP